MTATTLYYEIDSAERNFSKRILRFVKNNVWLYIPDIVLIIFLILPPYEIEKTLMIVSALVVLGFRDLVILRRSTYCLSQFKVKDQTVFFSIMKYNQVFYFRQNHIANVDLILTHRPFRLVIMENDKMIHHQYAIGHWNKKRLKKLYKQYKNMKQDISIETMFKREV